jgi:hypothetical protein
MPIYIQLITPQIPSINQHLGQKQVVLLNVFEGNYPYSA